MSTDFELINKSIPSLDTIQTTVGEPVRRRRSSLTDPSSQEKEDNPPDGGLKAYSVVLGSFLGTTANFGTVNSVGAIQTYISSHSLSDTPAVTISWIFSIYIALSFTLTVATGPYFDSRGALQPLIVGNLLMFGGFFGVASSTTVWQFILSLSICVSIGSALCISPLMGVIGHWFYDKIGIALGLSSVGGSVGGMVIPLMLRSLYAKVGFVWAIRGLAFLCLGLNTCACVLVKERIGVKTTPTASDEPVDKKNVFIIVKNYFVKKLKDYRFLFLVLGALCGEVSLLSIITYYGTYAITQGLSESDSYILLTLYNGTGIAGRICLGWLGDKFGHFNIMILCTVISTICILVMWLPFGSSPGVLYAFILIFGFTSALIMSLTPACLRRITPAKVFGSTYGLMYLFVSTGNLFGIPIGAAIIGDLTKFNYDMFVMYCGIIHLVSALSWILSRYFIVGFKFNTKV